MRASRALETPVSVRYGVNDRLGEDSDMADQVKFAVQRRTERGRHLGKLRRQGIVPGNIVIHGKDSIAVQFSGLDFSRLKAKHAPTTLWRLSLGDGAGEQTALVRHIQHEPVTGAVEHVDFQVVALNQLVHARLPVRFTGESAAVRTFSGVMLTLQDTVEVEGRPGDLPPALELDISKMEQLKDSLHVRDIVAPKGVRVLTDPDEPVVKVEPPRTLAEEAPAPAAEEAEAEAGAAEEAGGAGENAEEPQS